MKSRGKTLLVIVLFLTAGLAGGATLAWNYQRKQATRSLSAYRSYLKQAEKIDKLIYLGLPIYEDFRTPAREARLRKYLLAEHLAVARNLGRAPIQDFEHIKDLLATGKLVKLEQNQSTPWIFFNVKSNLRLLTPGAARGLKELGERFQTNVHRRLVKKFKNLSRNYRVKFAISSALRPHSYQNNLRGRNVNAATRSSHSYGISFDIFYDEFFVQPGENADASSPGYEYIKPLEYNLGRRIGRARRRQLRAVLAETLLELQQAGKLYVIWERNQRCYHVTIL